MKRKPSQFKDRNGVVLKPGDVIVYAVEEADFLYLRYAIVLHQGKVRKDMFTETVVSIRIIGVDDGWNRARKQKPSSLRYSTRSFRHSLKVMKIEWYQVPSSVRNILSKVDTDRYEP